MIITEFIYLSFFVLVIAAKTMCLTQFIHFILGFERGNWVSGRIFSKAGLWIANKSENEQIKGNDNSIYQLISCIFCLNVWVNVATFAITYQFLIEFNFTWVAFFFFSQIILSHKSMQYGY